MVGDTKDLTANLYMLIDKTEKFIKEKSFDTAPSDKNNSEAVSLDMNEFIASVVKSVIAPLYKENFFLFLTVCAFLQYYIELNIYSFYPFAALNVYEAMLGATFDRRLEEYKNLENTTDGEYYDIQPFLEIGMKYTADFINGEKEKLSHDLDMLVGQIMLWLTIPSCKNSICWNHRKRSMYISKKEFTEWSKTAREKRSLCENGEMTLEEFQAWLDESK